MSTKSTIDSDLYGDIYGDDEVEVVSGAEPEEDAKTETAPVETQTSLPANTGLPARPLAQDKASLSYSAQIAQQFSQYQQTPGQERQARQQLGAPIPTHDSTASSIPSADLSDSIFGKKPSEMHDAGKLFIGGLNWDTTDEGLRDYFNQFGKVDAVTIMRDNNGTSRGFAFLTFEDPSVVSVITSQDHVLDGKAIDPKRAIPREEHLRNTRYFVGGLAPHTTSESMKAFFSAFGKVVDATVMLDRESGRSKGFGFVTFEDAQNTDQLVGKHLIMDDKQIEVKLAQARSQREAANKVNQPTIQADTRQSLQNMPLLGAQNPMSMMFQRGMGQMPMAGMMNMMNPMAMMGGQMNPAMMGMGMGMGMGMMGGMGGMAGMSGMHNMRMGMGPMGGAGGAGAMGMGARTGMRTPVGRMGTPNATGAMNAGGAMNSGGVGPARVASRGQHNFHPYAR